MDIATTRELIGKLLTNIGSRNEVEQYLRYYASAEPEKFAIIEVSATAHESLVSSLAFLHSVGLRPIIVLAPTLDQALPTTPERLAEYRRACEAETLRLVEALEALGTRARPILGGVFRADRDAEAGFYGRATRAETTSVMSAIKMTQMPILAPLGETAEGQIVRLAPASITPALAQAVVPHKIIYLGSGALADREGHAISAINLEEDFATVQAMLGTAEQERLAGFATLLRGLPRTTSISITSPDHLARELFTYRGAGTLVRLGERIQTHTSFATTDLVRLRALLEDSFGRRLDDDYFTKKQPIRIFLAESYRATAVLTNEHDIPYLDKFAVTSEAQGEGIGSSIWQRMSREYPRLFWRSRTTNPINAWYAQKADGMYKSDPWTVFWCGVRAFSEIQTCVETALALPVSLEARP